MSADSPEPVGKPPPPKQVSFVFGAAGVLFGFVAGLFVGSSGRDARRDAPDRGACPEASSRASVATRPNEAPPAPSASVAAEERPATPPEAGATYFDMSAPDLDPRLAAHRAPSDVDGRSGVLVGSVPLVVHGMLRPLPPGTLLAVVAHGSGSDATLSAAVGGAEVATWTLRDHWSLLAAPFSPDLGGGAAAVAFTAKTRGASQHPDVVLAAVFAEEAEDRFLLDLRKAEHRARLLSGFYGVEGLDTSVPTVWSRGKCSRLGFLLAPSTGEYRLRVGGRSLPALAPLAITVRLNGARLGTLTGTLAPSVAELGIPSGVLVRGGNEIEFSYPATARPSKTDPGSRDDRDLALNVERLEVVPASTAE